MGVYLPYGFEPMTAQRIVERYNQILDEIDNDMYFDYVDNLLYDETPHEFELKYIPPDHGVRLFINGVFYDEDSGYFLVDRENRKLYWMWDSSQGGFDLQPFWKYTALYNIFYEDNGLSGPADVE